MKIIDRFIIIFWKQNSWHKHGVLVHTLKVVYHIIWNGHYNMFIALILHDIWKPLIATRDDTKEISYSFTWHEEKSYQLIKNIPFFSDYTKNLVRWHYLIRWIKKSKEKSLDQNNTDKEKLFWKTENERLKKIYETLNADFKNDLAIFLNYDDLGK